MRPNIYKLLIAQAEAQVPISDEEAVFVDLESENLPIDDLSTLMADKKIDRIIFDNNGEKSSSFSKILVLQS